MELIASKKLQTALSTSPQRFEELMAGEHTDLHRSGVHMIHDRGMDVHITIEAIQFVYSSLPNDGTQVYYASQFIAGARVFCAVIAHDEDTAVEKLNDLVKDSYL